MMPIIVRWLAWEDLADICTWYDARKIGLGDQFRDALEDGLRRIQSQPKLYAAGFRGIRKGRIDGFPDYLIIYRIRSHEIEVSSIVHGRRSPTVWTSRIDP